MTNQLHIAINVREARSGKLAPTYSLNLMIAQ